MRKYRGLLLVACFALCLPGCLARQVARDGCNFREALLSMYTDQVMDNLIRAHKNEPFVQLAYTNLVVTDSQILTANVADTVDSTSATSVGKLTGALVAHTSGLTNRILFGGSGENGRRMEFRADPAAKNDIYVYYLAFAKDPSLFGVSDRAPCIDVHMKRKDGCRWYWVPAEAAGVFLQLVLKTTFMRGPETPPPVYWPTTIASIEPRMQPGSQEPYPNKYIVTLCQAVPNDTEGRLSLILGGDCCPIDLSVDESGTTERFVSVLKVQSRLPLPVCGFAGCRASFYSPYDPNPGSKSPDLERLEAAVDSYRCKLNQQP
jgi:hypothetical protein